MRKALVSVLLAFLPALCLAQNESATLSGRVTDPTGAAVVGAEVVLTNVDTNVEQRTKTNSAGLYVFTGVHPGKYRVAAGSTGFKTLIKENLVLNVQDEIAENFSLSLGSVAETVTVNADDLHINTSDATVSTVVDRKFVENLPMNGRSFNTLLQLTPGVVIAPSGAFTPGQYSVNGQRTNANYFVVDGVGANFGVNTNTVLGQNGTGAVQGFNAFGGTSSLVSADAMQEFRVQTSTFAPEYGRTPGGQVSISTRSGTNQFHGRVFEYFRNDKLDANDWFANSPSKPRAPERQNDFGGVLGGPIVPGRTFFFLSYEGLRLRLPQVQLKQVPSLAVRNAGTTLAAVKPYLNAYPQPNGPVSPDGNTAQFTSVFSNASTADSGSIRIDHLVKSDLLLFGRFNEAPSELKGRPSGLNEIDTTHVGTRTLTLGSDWQISSRNYNAFRANYSLQAVDFDAAIDSFGGAVPPGPQLLLGSASPQSNRGILNLVGVGAYSLGRLASNRVAQLNLLDDHSLTVGKHQLKFGVDYRNLFLRTTSIPNFLLYVGLSVPQFATTGNVIVLAQTIKGADLGLRSLSFYGQDSWKVNQRLTLTYGLRWEIVPPPNPRHGSILATWDNIGDPSKTALAPFGTPLWETRYGNFAPRVGLAYSVTSKNDLVLRGGWGIFYDLGVGAAPNIATSFPNSASTVLTGTLPFSNPLSLVPVVSLTPPYTSNIFTFARDLRLPYSQQWNVALEKSMWGQQAASLTYVGQLGRRLLRPAVTGPPNGNFTSQFSITQNADTSDYHALQVQYRKRLSAGIQALANYTWSHSLDTSSDDSTQSLASPTSLPVQGDRGSSSFDVRHNFTGAITYDLRSFAKNAVIAQIVNHWSISAVGQVRTGFPINVGSQNFSQPIAGSFPFIRPDLVPGMPMWIQDATVPGGKRLNGAAFVPPTGARQGNLGRNSIYGFGLSQIDFSVGRQFLINERLNVQFVTGMFNLLNHPNFTNPSGDLRNAPSSLQSAQMVNRGLGGLSSLYQIGGPRSVQLALKLSF